MKLNLEQIKEIIPHRDPFLLIDEMIEMTETKAVGIKKITENEFYFKGHFPSKPVMPGVLIIESLAQVGAVVLLSKEQFKGKIAFFAGIKEAKFRHPVLPGDVLRLECELIKIRGNYGIGQAYAYVSDKLVCEAVISFAIN